MRSGNVAGHWRRMNGRSSDCFSHPKALLLGGSLCVCCTCSHTNMRFSALYILVLFSLMLSCNALRAATFVVTSRADSGPGSLREAISLASINGVATRDFIRFNLPGTTLADRTIDLLTELPSLPSNVEIDGTSQPSAFIGVSGAKVVLTYTHKTGNPNTFAFFFLNEVNDVAIYGMSVKYTGPAVYSAQFLMFGGNTSRITVGAPAKGNVATGCITGVYQQSGDLSYLTMQGNILGLPEDGTVPANPGLPNVCRFQFPYATSNLFIGGATPAEGNVLSGAMVMTPVDGQVVFQNNKINTDYTGAIANESGALWIGCLHYNAEVTITDNVFGTTDEYNAIYLSMTEKNFLIARNKIGTDITGTNVIGSNREGILLAYCKDGVVADNIIAGQESYGLVISDCYNVTVTKNTMFCNWQGNVWLQWIEGNAGRKEPFVNVTTCNATTISGDATPNAVLELFDTYTCGPGQHCDGRNYIRSVMADANGKWSYNYNGEQGLILTATDPQGATSEYSTAKLYFDPAGVKVGFTACGKNTGYVKGISVLRGYDLQWEDLAGNVVSKDTVLENVGEGWYNLVVYSAGCKDAACKLTMGSFHVETLEPQISRNGEVITNASCGQANGSITSVITSGLNIRKIWTNAAGMEISRADNLTSLAPGSYYLTITDTVNGCSASAGPFVIANLGGPSIDISNQQITGATCRQANGSITGITATGSGTINYVWKNAGGNTVGNQPALPGVIGGTYTLEVTDGSTCAAPATQTFTIPDAGSVDIINTALVITPSGCNAATGAISGLTAANAQTYTWTNSAGQMVGTTLNLQSIAAGDYHLLAENAAGCKATADVTVPQAAPAGVTVSNRLQMQPQCNQANGSVTDVEITGATPAAFRWQDANGNVLSNTSDLRNVGSGTYYLYMRDVNQCEQLVLTSVMQAPEPPRFVQTNLFITFDECNAGNGAISGFIATGAPPLSYAWKRGGEVVATTQNLLRAQAGVYVLEVKDGNGCTASSIPMTIGNNTVPLSAPTYSAVTIVKGMEATLKPSSPPLIGTYSLYATGGNSVLSSSDNGSFKVPGLTATTTFDVVYSRGECRSQPIPVTVNVVDAITVQVPNAFSPNGDGHNDVFRVKASGLASVTYFNIHDRWGNLIFSTKDINVGWNGLHNDRKVPAGTYVWSFMGTDLVGKEVKQQGVVVVVY